MMYALKSILGCMMVGVSVRREEYGWKVEK